MFDRDVLIAEGVYDPLDPKAPERWELIEYLASRGASLERMVEEKDRLPALAGELAAFPDVAYLSVAEVAEKAGVSEERLLRFRLACGLPVGATDQLPAYVVDDMVAFELGASLMGDAALFAFTRVLGAAADRVTAAGVSLFFGELLPTLGPDTTELDLAKLSESSLRAFANVPNVLGHLIPEHFRQAALHATKTAQLEGSQQLVGIGFVDLAGSTEWAEGLSLRDHSLALAEFELAAWNAAVEHGGRVVKLIGDEVMFEADTANAVCTMALELIEAIEANPILPGARGAVGFGVVISREGDYFGSLINLVARCVKVAGVGEVVLSQEVLDSLDDRAKVTDLGPQSIRGFEAPVRLYSMR